MWRTLMYILVLEFGVCFDLTEKLENYFFSNGKLLLILTQPFNKVSKKVKGKISPPKLRHQGAICWSRKEKHLFDLGFRETSQLLFPMSWKFQLPILTNKRVLFLKKNISKPCGQDKNLTSLFSVSLHFIKVHWQLAPAFTVWWEKLSLYLKYI